MVALSTASFHFNFIEIDFVWISRRYRFVEKLIASLASISYSSQIFLNEKYDDREEIVAVVFCFASSIDVSHCKKVKEINKNFNFFFFLSLALFVYLSPFH